MIHLPDLQIIVRTALKSLDKADRGQWSIAAEQLMLGTAVTEPLVGRDMHLFQMGGGPALGLCQVERATHASLWQNRLRHRPALRAAVEAINPRNVDALAWNIAYNFAIARQVYRRAPAALPAAGDAKAMAAYWKRWFNTSGGKGDPKVFERRFKRYVLPLYAA